MANTRIKFVEKTKFNSWADGRIKRKFNKELTLKDGSKKTYPAVELTDGRIACYFWQGKVLKTIKE